MCRRPYRVRALSARVTSAPPRTNPCLLKWCAKKQNRRTSGRYVSAPQYPTKSINESEGADDVRTAVRNHCYGAAPEETTVSASLSSQSPLGSRNVGPSER